VKTVPARPLRRLLAAAGVVALTAVGLNVFAPQAAAAPGVNPNNVELTLGAGESQTIAATVTTPPVPPNPDIVFLADTTGSMQPVLANVSQNIRRIVSEIHAAQPTARFAVTEYKENRNTRAFHVNTPLTADENQVATGVSDWLINVGGGGAPWTDFINAHWRIGTDAVAFRPNSTRIVAWFGDARSHDPSMGHPLDEATEALKAQGVRVIAVPIDGTTGGGLDALQQASRITAATAGELLPPTAANAVAQAILDGIRSVDVAVTPTVTTCAPELTVGFSPTTQVVPSGTDAAFQQTIGVRENTPRGDYQCTVDFRVGGVSAGYTQAISVHVPGTPPPVPTVSIGDVQVMEGNVGTTPATFAVTLSAPTTQEVRVNWTTRDGTAVAPADYSPVSGQLVIPAEQPSGTIEVAVNGDREVESDETYAVELTSATNATIANPRGVGTILNDGDGGPDPVVPVVSIGGASVPEGDSGTTPATLTLTLSRTSPEPVTVPWSATTGTTATPGEDFTVTRDTAVFPPNTLTAQVEVPVIGDETDEPDEQFTVELDTPTGATVGVGTGTVTITDDDDDGGGGDPVVSIGNATVVEGNTGTTPATFTLTLSEESDEQVTVTWQTRDGSATAPGDYGQRGGQVVFEPGRTSQPVDIAVVGDTLDEDDETFTVELTGAVGASLGANPGTGTITDDDDDPPPPDPTVSLGDTSVTEGNDGTTTAVLTATLDRIGTEDVTVPWATTTDGTATPGEDFTETGGELRIPAGQTSGQLEVPVTGDTADEPDEWFEVALGTPSGAVVGDGTGRGTILDDDTVAGPLPIASIGDTSVVEGNSGTAVARFTVRLDTAATSRFTVAWRTDDGSATTPSDYAGGTGEVVFAPGDVSKTLDIPVVGDLTVEGDETFTVTLTGSTGSTVGDGVATGTILNDDGNPGGDGEFTCLANALTLLGSRPAVANPGFDPCVTDDATAAKVRLSLGLISVQAGGLTATTDATATAVSANGGLLTTRISTIGLSIEVSAITSTATASCVEGEVVLAGSSSIAELKVNGVRIPIGTRPVSIPLVIGSLSLNSTVVDGDTVTQRAFALRTLLGDVVIGEAKAGKQDNPC
jgi:hypothetical protein